MKWSLHIALAAIVGCVVEQNIDGDATQITPAVEWNDGIATVIAEAGQSADEATQAAEERIANEAIADRLVLDTAIWALLKPSEKNDPVFRKARADACELYNKAYGIPKEDTATAASIFNLAIPLPFPMEAHMEAEALYNIGTSTENWDAAAKTVEDSKPIIAVKEARVIPVTKALDEEGKVVRKGDAADNNDENFDYTVDDEIALEAISKKDGTALKVEAILEEEGGKVAIVRGRNDGEGLTQVEGPIKVTTNLERANSAEGADKIGSLTSGEVVSKLTIADQGLNNSEGPTMFEGATNVCKDITERANIVECVDKVGSETDEKDLSQSQGLINVDDLNAIEGIATVMVGRVTKGDDLTKVERAINGEGATNVVKDVTNSDGANNAKDADKVRSTTDRQELPKVKCPKGATKGEDVINVKGSGKTEDREEFNLDPPEAIGDSEVSMEAITETRSANDQAASDNGVAGKVTEHKATEKQTGAKVAKLYKARQGMDGEVESTRGNVDRASKLNVSGNTEPGMVTGLVNDHTASDNGVTGKGAAEKATAKRNRPPLDLESAAKHNNPAVAVIILTFTFAVAVA